ncbi:MAG: hypothetical protein AcusKO_10530 [Acuticoccus sp.]
MNGGANADLFLIESDDIIDGDFDVIADFAYGTDAVFVDPVSPKAIIVSIFERNGGTVVKYLEGYKLRFDGVDVDVVQQLADDGDIGILPML